jgi:hypothetical protein
MFDRQRYADPGLPAGRAPLSVDELRRMWAAGSNGETDWFAAYDPALASDGQIVEMIAELLHDRPGGTADVYEATSSTSNPSAFSRYVA